MSQFVDLARNLLSLEINTVVKSGMSAEKMPLLGDALIDTAQDYYLFLCQHMGLFGDRDSGALLPWAARLSESFDWGVAPFQAPAGTKTPKRYQPEFLSRDLPGNDPRRGTMVAVFNSLREVASWTREMLDRLQDQTLCPSAEPDLLFAAAKVGDDVLPVLMRIQRNSDQINDLLKRRGLESMPCQRGDDDEVRRMPALTSADIVIIRKAWDMGTEVIVMQSTIQIDGDVITRLQRGGDALTNGTLIGVHKEAVDVSFRYWSFLIDTLGRFAGTAVNRLVGDTG